MVPFSPTAQSDRLRPVFALLLFIASFSLACGGPAGSPDAPAPPTLTARASATADTDLAIVAVWPDAPGPAQRRYLNRADLLAHPAVTTATVKIDFQENREASVTALPVSALLASLGVLSTGDLVIADCRDGYQSHYDAQQLPALDPVLVLAIDGEGPEVWGKRNGEWRYGPNYISIRAEADLPDPGSKRPFGLTTLTVTSWAERFAEIDQGARGAPDGPVARGREIFRNHCLACHRTGSGLAGGNLSNRAVEVVAAQSKYNRDYFNAIVRDPAAVMPGIAMGPHPHYTDADYAALHAYLALW